MQKYTSKFVAVERGGSRFTLVQYQKKLQPFPRPPSPPLDSAVSNKPAERLYGAKIPPTLKKEEIKAQLRLLLNHVGLRERSCTPAQGGIQLSQIQLSSC